MKTRTPPAAAAAEPRSRLKYRLDRILYKGSNLFSSLFRVLVEAGTDSVCLELHRTTRKEDRRRRGGGVTRAEVERPPPRRASYCLLSFFATIIQPQYIHTKPLCLHYAKQSVIMSFRSKYHGSKFGSSRLVEIGKISGIDIGLVIFI